MAAFINRLAELEFLDRAWADPSAQLLVVYGRRRVGKTALLRRFAEDRPSFHYLATRLPEAQQLRELGRGVAAAADEPLLAEDGFQSWEQVFTWIARLPHRFALIIDELPYLVEANPALPSLLQRAWDTRLAESGAFVVLCGSSVAMMEREVLSERAPLYGRRTGQLRLTPFSFTDAAGFFPRYGFEDRVRAWSVVGGVPYYMLFFDDTRSLAKNLDAAVFATGAPLQDEVEFLLRQELREPRVYFGILAAIAAGKHKLGEILNATGLTSPTAIKYLAVLQQLGLVIREVPATETRPEKSKKGLYVISDPFVRFWFRHVLPQRSLLETGRSAEAARRAAADLDAFAAPAYEDICRHAVSRGLLDGGDAVRWQRAGRWWSRTAEIDLVAMAEDGREVLFGEAKWSSRPLGTNILQHLEEAAQSVDLPSAVRRRRFALFSRAGFTNALRREAAARQDVHLVHHLTRVEEIQ